MAERVIDIYLASNNFAEANEWAVLMSIYARDFSVEQQKRIISSIKANGQVCNSNELGKVLRKLRQTDKIPPQEFDALLKENDLERFVPIVSSDEHA